MDKYISGNKTYQNLLVIKRGDIGWVFPNEELKVKDLNHEKSLNMTLNKVTGEWDFEKLQDLFNDLSIEGIDLKFTGWDKEEIQRLNKQIDLTNFGEIETIEEHLNESLNNDTKNSNRNNEKPIKHYECPSCGYQWTNENTNEK